MNLRSNVAGPFQTATDSPSSVIQPAWKIPLWIETSCNTSFSQPIAFGVPVPRAFLHDAATLMLLDPEGCQVAAQTNVTSRWHDGSIRWLSLEFILPSTEAGRASWHLIPDKSPRPGTELHIENLGRSLLVDTGVARFHVDGSRLAPLACVIVTNRDVLDAASTGVTLTCENGREAGLQVERFDLEEQGPVRATVRLEGNFRSQPKLRFIARCDFFSGTGLVRLRLTIHNPQRAQHPGGLWDLGDSGSVFFKDLSLTLGLAGEQIANVIYETEPGVGSRMGEPGGLEIYQDSSGGENWRSRNHVDRHGRVPTSFRGYRVRSGDRQTLGLRANPVVALEGQDVSIAAAIPEFWQQFPKAIEARENALTLRLFPRQFSSSFELQGGEKKTNTIWLHFDARDDPTRGVAGLGP